jgi:hypothetical protein
MSPFTLAKERTRLKASQITSGRRAGRLRDTDIVFRTPAASISVDSLFEHPCDHFFLARFQPPAKSIIELGFRDMEFDARIVMELGGVGRDRARELLLTTEGSVELALEILDAEVSLGSR